MDISGGGNDIQWTITSTLHCALSGYYPYDSFDLRPCGDHATDRHAGDAGGAVLHGDRLPLLQRVPRGQGGRAGRLAVTPGREVRRRAELPPDQQVGALRPPLRGHQRGGAADRAGAGGAVRVHAGAAVDRGRRLPGRGGAGFPGAGGQPPPGRQVAGPDRLQRHRQSRRDRRHGCDPVHPGDRAGGAGEGGRQGAGRGDGEVPRRQPALSARERQRAASASADGVYTIPAGTRMAGAQASR